MMKTYLWIIFLLCMNTPELTTLKDTPGFTNILRNLQWTNSTIIHSGRASEAAALIRSASRSMIQVNIQPNNWSDFDRVCIFGFKVEHLDILGNILRMRRPPDTVMIVLEDHELLQHTFKEQFRQFDKCRSFYRVTSSQLFHHTTFRDQNVLLEHEIDCQSEKCSLDLKGFSYENAIITQKAKEWPPWLFIHSCTDNKFCASSGILHDIMDVMAHSHNFSWVLHTSNGAWGGSPLSNNWSDPNAVFDGIFGEIVYDEIDVVLSIWANALERYPFSDISTTFYTRKDELYVNSKSEVLDRYLLTKPFTLAAWCGIATLISIITGIYKLGPTLLVFWGDCWYTQKLLILLGWVFFNIINAYYGGALTMHLSIPPTYPFSTVQEGLNLYPDWKMLILQESQISVLLFKATESKHVQALNSYIDLISSHQGKHLVPDNFSKTLELLQEPGHFLLVSDQVRFSENYFKNQESRSLNLHLVGRDGTTKSGFAMPKYSPHTKILNYGKKIVKPGIK